MQEISSLSAMRAWTRAEKARGRRVGFVPTMGFLHEGHLRLVDRARELADRVVLSVFVYPLQFGPQEDFGRYPRDLDRDRQLTQARSVDCLFAPERSAMYPAEPIVRVAAGPMADVLEGKLRPGHFSGVLTVVAKLFHVVEPRRPQPAIPLHIPHLYRPGPLAEQCHHALDVRAPFRRGDGPQRQRHVRLARQGQPRCLHPTPRCQ